MDIGGLDGTGYLDSARYATRYGTTTAGFPNYLEKEWKDVVPARDGKVRLKHRWCLGTPYRVIERGTNLVKDGESGSGAGAESLEPERERSRSRGRGGRRGN